MQRQVAYLYLAVAMTLLCSTSAQRPSFAGPRPTNGLNQKDKYHQTSSDTGNDITNRFGAVDSPVVNTLAFGAPQNPPVGYPVVSPLPALQPVEDRFGSIDTVPANKPSFGFGSGFGPQGFNPSFFGGTQGGSAQGFIPQYFGQGGNTQGFDPQSLAAQGASAQGVNPGTNPEVNNRAGVNTQSLGAQGSTSGSQGTNQQTFGNPQSNIPQTTVQPQAGQVPTSVAATNQRLPFDAHGDQLLIDQLNALPVEKRPFWFLNYQAIEAQRNSSTPFAGGLSPRGSFFG